MRQQMAMGTLHKGTRLPLRPFVLKCDVRLTGIKMVDKKTSMVQDDAHPYTSEIGIANGCNEQVSSANRCYP